MNKDKRILAIDPGNVMSGFVLIGEDGKIYNKGKVSNEKLRYYLIWLITNTLNTENLEIVIEMIGSYGMPVGRSVFDTCIFIGRLQEVAWSTNEAFILPTYIERRHVKLNLCNSSKAKDRNIIQSLVERFSPENTKNYGKGTKKNQGWFYGFSADIWQAYALGITYIDTKNGKYTL